jgi:anaerobic selenocysteine-containing dehydrogenase
MAMVQLLLGNIGVAGGGMNALRGHSNIQGLTDVGLLCPTLMPGYLTMPKDKEATSTAIHEDAAVQAAAPGPDELLAELPKFFVSFQKAMYGDAATAENNWAYDWLPKLDVPGYDILRAFEMMHEGKMNGYICQGFNPMQAFPDRGKIAAALAS